MGQRWNKFKDFVKGETDPSEEELQEVERTATAKKALKDAKFLDFLAELPEDAFQVEDIQEVESDPEKAAKIERYYTAFKERGDIEKSLKAVFEAAWKQEFKGADAKETGKLPETLWQEIKTEMEAELKTNPEALLQLRDSMAEQQARLKEIGDLEKQISQRGGNSEKLRAIQDQINVIANLIEQQPAKKPEDYTLEEQAALKAVRVWMRVGTNSQAISALTKRLDYYLEKVQGDITIAENAEGGLEDIQREIAESREALFGQHKYGELIVKHAEAKHQEHVRVMLEAHSNRDEGAAAKALPYFTDLEAAQSHLGVKDLIKEQSLYPTELFETLQKQIEEEFKANLQKIVEKEDMDIKLLNSALTPLLTEGSIGSTQGFENTRPIITRMMSEIYKDETDKKKKVHLMAYLVKHDLYDASI